MNHWHLSTLQYARIRKKQHTTILSMLVRNLDVWLHEIQFEK